VNSIKDCFDTVNHELLFILHENYGILLNMMLLIQRGMYDNVQINKVDDEKASVQHLAHSLSKAMRYNNGCHSFHYHLAGDIQNS
jgi:hypothetical protein